ncbi:hypothetical protein CHUAL_013142 [Chamberlinius hualienensis]
MEDMAHSSTMLGAVQWKHITANPVVARNRSEQSSKESTLRLDSLPRILHFCPRCPTLFLSPRWVD